MQINKTIAAKYADPECSECGGTGWTYQGVEQDNRIDVYCFCAKGAMEEHEAEGRKEE